eukprot:CAMPEP_0173393256 /NCGR_PEP_ID=MMETSP1356-20130122/22007_1 /TAXON_ID=77927 ORGANISM="Hemiselmis virescens, Strain PCC157" /NCGR_SAMPLE_ID=MMETSP1356 /ASSEMBLY_ACC=CAM_ASM_000847 /LENGTH=349 /DNA_ID=CAMNT_0014351255 /DNA_START=13 /DNA_END=1062 /DNA_ORIENTATION=-
MAVVTPLLGNHQARVRAAVVATMAAGLLGVVAVTMSVGSAPSAMVESRLHEWSAAREQGLPYGLRRQEQLTDMRSEASRDGEMNYIFGKARQGRLQGLAQVGGVEQQLHEWDAGRVEGLSSRLRRSEKLSDMRQTWNRAGEMGYIFGGRRARAGRMQGLAQYSYEGLNGDQQRAVGDQEEMASVQNYGHLAQILSPIVVNAASNGRAAAARPRTQALSEWGQGGGDWGLQRREKLGFMHESNEDAYDSNAINGPLDQDMKQQQSGLKAQHLQMLHQQVMSGYAEAVRDPSKRAAFKQQLTMLCDQGRSHPQYWALKTELDKVDGGEDDSDTVDSFDDDGFGGDMDSSFD